MIQPTAHLTKIGEWVMYDVHDFSHHYTVKGTVLMVPKLLYDAGDSIRGLERFDRSEQLVKQKQFLNNRSLEFATQMEVQVGDEVVFRYSNHMEAMAQGLYWHVDSNKVPAMFVPYDTLFMANRGDDQIMLNGWAWVEPVLWSKDELENEHGMVVEKMANRKTGIGVVRNIGKVNGNYLYDKRGGDADDVDVGDTVLFKKTAGVCAEWFCHQSLNKGRYPYYVMQRRDILAKVNSNGKI